MMTFQPLIRDDSPPLTTQQPYRFDFVEQTLDEVFLSVGSVLDDSIFQILIDPKALVIHVQRIYFCYRHDLTDELFAALLDLLIVLEGKGVALSRRMVFGAKPKLNPADYSRLTQALTEPASKCKLLKGNSFSVFSLGLIGTVELVVKKQNEPKTHDPLAIARDFVAYSQLDEAMDTLEQAILQDGDRHALHDDLLELYRITRNVERFTNMYTRLSEQMTHKPMAWDELKGSFNEG